MHIFKHFFYFRAFWAFRKHFPDIADQVYSGLDPATQKTLERERDILSGNGGSMSASLRGSNSSLNSMPGGVISKFILNLFKNIYILNLTNYSFIIYKLIYILNT